MIAWMSATQVRDRIDSLTLGMRMGQPSPPYLGDVPAKIQALQGGNQILVPTMALTAITLLSAAQAVQILVYVYSASGRSRDGTILPKHYLWTKLGLLVAMFLAVYWHARIYYEIDRQIILVMDIGAPPPIAMTLVAVLPGVLWMILRHSGDAKKWLKV
jgi:hypothetical protein